MIDNLGKGVQGFIGSMGFARLLDGPFPGATLVMLLISFVLLYLAIVKRYEPLLLIPIAFGMLLTNLPLGGLMDPPAGTYGETGFSPGGCYTICIWGCVWVSILL